MGDHVRRAGAKDGPTAPPEGANVVYAQGT
ncbi:MAG: hypothetical protein HW381_1309, partial [Candidatus Rokubacteria bacterium]|nr:hypothetical protein [Candidatus Rokubacteria bacterium]